MKNKAGRGRTDQFSRGGGEGEGAGEGYHESAMFVCMARRPHRRLRPQRNKNTCTGGSIRLLRGGGRLLSLLLLFPREGKGLGEGEGGRTFLSAGGVRRGTHRILAGRTPYTWPDQQVTLGKFQTNYHTIAWTIFGTHHSPVRHLL
jgi:hypothetical protein